MSSPLRPRQEDLSGTATNLPFREVVIDDASRIVHVHAPVLGHSGHALSNRNLGQQDLQGRFLRQLELWLHSLHHLPRTAAGLRTSSVVKNRWRLEKLLYAGVAAHRTGPIEARRPHKANRPR